MKSCFLKNLHLKNKVGVHLMAVVSVIVPVYNAEKYIYRCLQSIAESDYYDFEAIVIDDGSTDSSGKICDEFAKTDKRFLVIHENNQGVSHARNEGLEHSNGKYILFVDADDSVGKTRVSTLVNNGKADYIQCSYTNVTNQGNFKVSSVEGLYEIDYYKQLLWNNEIVMPSFVWCARYTNRIIKEHHIRFNEKKTLGEDIIFNLDYLSCCKNVQFIEDYEYFHNNIKTSLVHKFYDNRELKEEQEIQKLEQFFQRTNMRMRFFGWHSALNHYKLWQQKGDTRISPLAKTKEKECYHNSYFRESLPFIRTNGSLDEKIETYLMGYFRHKLYKYILPLLKAHNNNKNETD